MLIKLGSSMSVININRVTTFAPTDIANLSLWLDASDTSTITEIGGAVSQWDDKSGNNNHATQGTASNQPVTGTRTMNGLNTLDFDADYMLLPSGLYNITTADNTVISVFATDDISSDQRIYSGNDSATPNSSRLMTRLNFGTSSSIDHRSTGTTETAVIPITKNTNPHINLAVRSGNVLSAYYDGGSAATSAASNTILASLKIGSNTSGNGAWFDGRLIELIMFNRALTDTEINQVGNYLAGKWGITWTDI